MQDLLPRSAVPLEQVVTVLDDLPNILRATRLRRRLTLAVVAEQLGTGEVNVHRWERRKATPTLATARKILEWAA